MHWKKIGLIFATDASIIWQASHAAVPIPFHLEGDRYRVYFSARDPVGRAQFAFVELDLKNPREPLAVAEDRVLGLGELGCFDESGVIGDWIVRRGADLYLYYTGWNRGLTVPFRNAIGLAISRDGGLTFARYSSGPILDRSIHDPCFVSNPCVLVEDHRCRMWYISGLSWEMHEGAPRHYYHLKYAESVDGVQWDRRGVICIDFQNEGEYAISRPCVIHEDGVYKMWYSYRGPSYRIGYAESLDGIKWQRKDELAGIDVSESAWDSEMIEYGFVFDHQDRRYLLYNGNEYGKTGIGLAILDQ